MPITACTPATDTEGLRVLIAQNMLLPKRVAKETEEAAVDMDSVMLMLNVHYAARLLIIADGKDEGLLCERECEQWIHNYCAGIPVFYFQKYVCISVLLLQLLSTKA